MGLAAKLGEVAMALLDAQDRASEEEGEADDAASTCDTNSLVSQDMFEATQEYTRTENPLLAARAKREELVPRPAITSQRLESRNPFARKAAAAAALSSPANSSSNGGSSLTFDSAVPAVRPSPITSKSAAVGNKFKVGTLLVAFMDLLFIFKACRCCRDFRFETVNYFVSFYGQIIRNGCVPGTFIFVGISV